MQIFQEIKEDTDALIARCVKGDEASFKKLYLLYNKAMYNVCLRMLNNEAESQDVLQESFITAFKSIAHYKGIGSFGSWLKRIVINKCIDSLRKKNKNLVPINEDTDLTPDEEYEEEYNYEPADIINAVAQLADGYRLILTLYLFEDHSHRMIAEKLNISEGTSKSQYARARKKLISILKGSHD